MAGASMNDIKARMKSVKSTMQITKAMELVATSKLRRAKERAEKARPYHDLLAAAIRNVMSASELSDSAWASAESDKTLIIAVAGDRGLAGGYNANIYRMVAALPEFSGECAILPIGKKAFDYYSHREKEIIDVAPHAVSETGVGDCMYTGEKIARLIKDGSFGRVILVYTKFKSMISQIPTAETLFPVASKDGAEKAQDPILAEEPEEFLDRVMPDYIGGALWCAICEASASESGARRTSMNAANKNATEMIDSLMLKYN
jgi:F-type H+-transporting ATPase subunit gamma